MANLSNINGYFNVTDTGLVNVVNGGLYVTKSSGDAIIGIISSGGNGRPYYLRSNTNGVFAIYDDTACLERLTILSGGNVGIGVTSPSAKLHIENGSSGAGSAWTNADELIIENSGNVGLTLQSPNTAAATIAFQDPESVQAVSYTHLTLPTTPYV